MLLWLCITHQCSQSNLKTSKVPSRKCIKLSSILGKSKANRTRSSRWSTKLCMNRLRIMILRKIILVHFRNPRSTCSNTCQNILSREKKQKVNQKIDLNLSRRHSPHLSSNHLIEAHSRTTQRAKMVATRVRVPDRVTAQL